MSSERKNSEQSQQQQDPLLQEGRNDDQVRNPFDQAQQNVASNQSLQEEADAEQELKEAMTERD